jgi:hypothetical protein
MNPGVVVLDQVPFIGSRVINLTALEFSYCLEDRE